MWTIDASCSRCKHRKGPQNPSPAVECLDRMLLIGGLQKVASELNEVPYSEGPGDGLLVVVCKDFEAA